MLVNPESIALQVYSTDSGCETVAFVPPLGVPAEAFLPTLSTLADDFRIITWDTRGYPGPTDDFDALDLSLSAHARDLLSIVDWVGGKTVRLVGYCSGAAVALSALRMRPGMSNRLALVCSALGISDVAGDSPTTKLAAELFQEMAQSRKLAAELGPILAGQVKSPYWDYRYEDVLEPQYFKSLLHKVYESAESIYRYAKLQCINRESPEELLRQAIENVLVISVDDDHVVPPNWGEYISGRFPGSRLVRYPRGGHWALCKGGQLRLDLEKFLREGL